MQFQNELDEVIVAAKANGSHQDPTIRQRIADAHIGLKNNALQQPADVIR